MKETGWQKYMHAQAHVHVHAQMHTYTDAHESARTHKNMLNYQIHACSFVLANDKQRQAEDLIHKYQTFLQKGHNTVSYFSSAALVVTNRHLTLSMSSGGSEIEYRTTVRAKQTSSQE